MGSKVFFPNLNGIRFIAAFAIIIHHIEQLRSIFGLSNYWNIPAFLIIGKLGVILFFVLSGFLITYLILKEKELTQTIAVKEFYIRRVLRIWPLYYSIGFLAFFVFPHFDLFNIPVLSQELKQNYLIKALLYMLILPNLASTLFAPVPFAAQAWSIGVEEQFYLIWPVLLKIFKNVINVLIGVIVIYLLIKFLLLGATFQSPDLKFFKIMSEFWSSFSIDCMAIGGIAAWILFEEKTAILKILYNKLLQILLVITLVVLIWKGIYIPYIHYEFYAVIFAVLILNLAANPDSFIQIKNKLFNFLGKISYGMYMFHMISIVLSLKILEWFSIDNHLLHYLFSITFTILFSSLSYKYFELIFIKRKLKYSKVISGDNIAYSK